MASEISALLELLHTGSLIIDDIEDDSESRRGLPSLHVAHGTPVALNAGNWIYFWAFKLVEHLPLGDAQQLSLMRHMSRALLACHFGQALDLSVAVDQLPRPQVPPLVRAATGLKTGRLMQLGAEVGAVAARADEACREALADFGFRVGLGLQMLDDLGGLTSKRRRHKGFEDLRLGRLTWPWAWAAELESDVSYTRLRDLARDVRAGRAPGERLAARLRESIGASGRRRIHEHLTDALAALDGALGPSELLADLRQEVARLEESYG
jgi:geranylgeranyl pyrophosphate synthase